MRLVSGQDSEPDGTASVVRAVQQPALFPAFDHYRASMAVGAEVTEGPMPEEQNGDYESGVVRIGSEWWRIRTGRITPKKLGAFVAVWTRDDSGATRPFGSDDTATGLLVFVTEGEHVGVFRFTAAHLTQLGITRSPKHPGKRGFRVYPSWSSGLNSQAQRTQAAQASAFRQLGPRSTTQPL